MKRLTLPVKYWLLACVACALVVAIGARIWWVNATAPQPPHTEHSFGEWIDLNGAFMGSWQENTEGYSIRVDRVEYMTPHEYLAAYGTENHKQHPELPDVRSLVVVTLDVKNRGNEEGGILLMECRMLARNSGAILGEDPDLWSYTEKAFEENNVPAVALAIKKDSDYTVHVPYVAYTYDHAEPYTSLPEPGKYDLILSWSPMRHTVEIDIPELRS